MGKGGDLQKVYNVDIVKGSDRTLWRGPAVECFSMRSYYKCLDTSKIGNFIGVYLWNKAPKSSFLGKVCRTGCYHAAHVTKKKKGMLL